MGWKCWAEFDLQFKMLALIIFDVSGTLWPTHGGLLGYGSQLEATVIGCSPATGELVVSNDSFCFDICHPIKEFWCGPLRRF